MLRFALALTFVTVVVEAVTTQSPAKAPQWVPEQGVSVAQHDGAIELNGSRGWIRLNSVVSDFVLEFDFRYPHSPVQDPSRFGLAPVTIGAGCSLRAAAVKELAWESGARAGVGVPLS